MLETRAACLNLKQRLIFFVLQNHWQNTCITSIRRAPKIEAYRKIISKISFSGSQGKLPHDIFCVILKQFHRFHTSVGFNFHVVYPTCNTWFTLAHARGDELRVPEVFQNFRKENFLSDAKIFSSWLFISRGNFSVNCSSTSFCIALATAFWHAR